jgi:hypothetical protein
MIIQGAGKDASVLVAKAAEIFLMELTLRAMLESKDRLSSTIDVRTGLMYLLVIFAFAIQLILTLNSPRTHRW